MSEARRLSSAGLSSNRFQSLFEYSPIPMLLLDKNKARDFVNCNQKASIITKDEPDVSLWDKAWIAGILRFNKAALDVLHISDTDDFAALMHSIYSYDQGNNLLEFLEGIVYRSEKRELELHMPNISIQLKCNGQFTHAFDDNSVLIHIHDLTQQMNVHQLYEQRQKSSEIVMKALLSQNSLANFSELVLSDIAAQIDMEIAIMWGFEPSRNAMQALASIGFNPPEAVQEISFEQDETFSGYAALTLEPILFQGEDFSEVVLKCFPSFPAKYRDFWDEHNKEKLRRIIIWPIATLSGKLMAMMSFSSRKSKIITDSDILFLDNISKLLVTVLERISAQEKLRESEERFSSFADNFPGPVYIKDHDSRVLFVNRYLRNKNPQREWIGKNNYELFSQETADKFTKEDIEVVSGKPIIQTRIREANNRIEKVSRTFKFPIEREGKQCLIGGFSLDITQEYIAVQALKDSETRYRLLVNTSPDGIAMLDLDANFIKVNAKTISLSGYTEYELLHMSAMLLISPEQVTLARQQMKNLMKGDPISPHVYTGICKDKKALPIEITTAVSRDENNIPSGFIVTIRDISIRESAKQALKVSEERLEFALSGADLGVWDWNLITDEINYNAQWAEILGFNLDNIVQSRKTWESLMHPDDIHIVMKRWRDHVDGKTPTYSSEHRMKTSDGKWKWILDRGKVVEWGSDGFPRRASGTHMDITEKKEVEAKVEESRKQVELFNDLMVHDINNMHQGIMTSLEILKMNPSTPHNQLEIINNALTQVTRSVSLIDNVRKYSEIAAHEYEPKELNPCIAISNAITSLRGSFPQKEINVQINSPNDELFVIGDEFLEDIFYNLLHNAAKFDNCLNVNIDINIINKEESEFMKFEVIDRGSGFSAQEKQKIESEPARSSRVSGMGLILIRKILERYGGKLSIEDRVLASPSEGTRMIVEIPKPTASKDVFQDVHINLNEKE